MKIKKGEIVGLAGLVGSGRSELAHTIFGDKKPDNGSIIFCGKKITKSKVSNSINLGMAMVPESRKPKVYS